MTASSPVRDATSLFRARFSSEPAVGASAPGRVNLIGEHLDYNGGPVLPCAINRRTVVAAGPAAPGHWEVCSWLDGEVVRLDPARPRPGWTEYAAGVIRVLATMRAAPPGARLVVASDVPPGAGLSSSAALCVALARALSTLARRRLPPDALAEVAYRAEHDEVGVRCGRMDQTASACGRAGHALLFETGSGAMRHVPLPGRIWILDTGVTHRVAGADYAMRRAECEEAVARLREGEYRIPALAAFPVDALPDAERYIPPPLLRRVRHVVTETARTYEAAAALDAGDLPRFGHLMTAAHASMRDDYQASCPEADLLVEAARRHGAWGARITGAGWGGSVIMLAPPARERRIVAEMRGDFTREFGREPAAWWSRAMAGARNERVKAATGG